MRTSQQTATEIEEKFGFLPPFFSPALQTPQVLENLWQQTLCAYIDNPLPSLFKEKLSAYLSRFCPVPYCLVCHSCSLWELGMQAQEILTLLETHPPNQQEVDEHLRLLSAQSGLLRVLSGLNSVLEESLLYCSIFIALNADETKDCRHKLRCLLGAETYQYLVTFIAYVKTCHEWMEAHPEVTYETDKRVQDNFDGLVAEEPELANFFNTYWDRVKQEKLGCSGQLQVEELPATIVDADTNKFLELIQIAGLDIKQDLAGANLSNIDLSNANLNSANLSNADLSNADLSNARLNGANLTNTNLLEANLSEADLTDAVLNNANLSGVALSNIKGLSLQKFDLDAISKKQELQDVVLSFPNYEQEAPIGQLGEILSSLQELIINIGQAVTGKLGQIPPNLVEDLQLTTYGTFESSYGIHLSGLSVNLTGESLLSDVLEEFMSLINVTKDANSLVAKLYDLSPDSARTYRNFLKSLINAKVKLSLKRSSPKIRRKLIKYAELPLDSSQLAFDSMDLIEFSEEKTLEIKGKLVAVNILTNTFGIKDMVNNNVYKGSIYKEALLVAATATIGDIYSATILQITKIYITASVPKTIYKLQNLRLERRLSTLSATIDLEQLSSSEVIKKSFDSGKG